MQDRAYNSAQQRNWALILVSVGLITGFLLYLWRDIVLQAAEDDILQHTLVYITSFTSAVFMLTYRPERLRESAALCLGIGLLIGLIYFGLAHYLTPGAPPENPGYLYGMTQSGLPWAFAWAYSFSAGLSVYILIAFIQTWMDTDGQGFPYENLFIHAWSNGILVIFACIFVGLFWGVLSLWAALFSAIDITFFTNQFFKARFAMPVSHAAWGLAIAMLFQNYHITGSLRRLVLGLFNVLANMMAVVIIMFLASLPFTGLQPLWNFGSGVSVLLAGLLATALLLNAVIQTGEDTDKLHPVQTGLFMVWAALMPVMAVLAIYALYLRIDQYGVTPDRVWAGAAIVIASLVAFSYLWAVVRYGKRFYEGVTRINPPVAAAIVVVAIGVHLPPFEPFNMSVNSIVERVRSGAVSPDDADLAYLKFRLGQPGRRALEDLRVDLGNADAEALIARLDEVEEATYYYGAYPSGLNDRVREANERAQEEEAKARVGDYTQYVEIYPKGTTLPEEIDADLRDSAWRDLNECQDKIRAICIIRVQDIEGDGTDEYIWFLTKKKNDEYETGADVVVNRLRDGHITFQYYEFAGDDKAMILAEAVRRGEVQFVPLEWQALKLGDITVSPFE